MSLNPNSDRDKDFQWSVGLVGPASMYKWFVHVLV